MTVSATVIASYLRRTNFSNTLKDQSTAGREPFVASTRTMQTSLPRFSLSGSFTSSQWIERAWGIPTRHGSTSSSKENLMEAMGYRSKAFLHIP